MSRAASLHVAVTGAGGFIGGRVAGLLEDAGAEVRRHTRSRLRLDDAAQVTRAIAGCDAVIHCAFDAYDQGANLAIADAVGRACAGRGARLVHLSTAAVYEPLPDGVLTEAAPTSGAATDYTAVKRAVEAHLLSLVATHGLDLAILQPTIVYGPEGGAWTDSPVRELLTGEVWLPDRGQGFCNCVYVDDVCLAAIAACTASLPSGERLLISGPGPVSWHDYFAAYQRMLGTDSLRLESAELDIAGDEATDVVDLRPGHIIPAQRPSGARAPAANLLQIARRFLLTRLGAANRSRLNFVVQRIRRRLRGRAVHRALGAKRALYRARCQVSTAKAERLLGVRPRFSLAEGMAETRAYVERTYGTKNWAASAPRVILASTPRT